MKHKSTSTHRSPRPLVVGTGLIALDAVVSADESQAVRYWAGGTCGNVLIALRYLGWLAKPIARLSTSKATDLLINDLRRWHVSQSFVRTDAHGSTPVIVERITKDSQGRPRHSFSWRCNECHAPFPGYKPELLTEAEKIAERLKRVSVFFFDRVSAGALLVAKAAADTGALVVFEPSGIGNPILFRQAWEISHVVKYSHERLRDFPEMDVEASPRLIIETLGDAGLRYRQTANKRVGKWIDVKALAVQDLKDAAGAGDWCTAGILSKVAATGLAGLSKISAEGMLKAMQYGQVLAAWSCRFEGARGGMYAVTKKQFHGQLQEIIAGTSHLIPIDRAKETSSLTSGTFCSICALSAAESSQIKVRKVR